MTKKLPFRLLAIALLFGTSAKAATIDSWSIDLDLTGRGIVGFSGSDSNNDGWLRSSDGEVTDFSGAYFGGTRGGPSAFGMSLESSGSFLLAYDLDGMFGNDEGEFISYFNTSERTCQFNCGPFGDFPFPNTFLLDDRFSIIGSRVSMSREVLGSLIFDISDDNGPLDVVGPQFGAPAPVPLPAAAWMLLAGMGALGAMSRKRRKG